MIKTSILSFQELSSETLYEILALRSAVFIVEQQCFYQDLDYKDQNAQHLLVHENNKLIGYGRILPYNDENSMSFGRLVTALSHRRNGLGKQMMGLILNFLKNHHPKQTIKITAQHYLQNFYANYGFVVQGAPFDMDGLPHVLMVKQP